jgi:ketosteroid isomerase-like protein
VPTTTTQSIQSMPTTMTASDSDPDTEPDPDAAAIRRVLDARLAALRTKDAERFASHFATDVVAFDLAPPLAVAGADVRNVAELDAWFATWAGPVEEAYAELSVTVAPEAGIAYCHGLVNLRGEKIGEGPADLWFRSTVCLGRVDGTWKITHEHSSTPFYMDGSYRAAIDLTP